MKRYGYAIGVDRDKRVFVDTTAPARVFVDKQDIKGGWQFVRVTVFPLEVTA